MQYLFQVLIVTVVLLQEGGGVAGAEAGAEAGAPETDFHLPSCSLMMTTMTPMIMIIIMMIITLSALCTASS